MTITQFGVLQHLAREGALPLGRLADLLVMERTSLYRTLAPIERHGWIAIAASRSARTKTAALTDAGLLSTMGLFDLFGTSALGWLTDRYDPRKLLVIYYGLRGFSLIALPFLDFSTVSLGIFAIFCGHDWIATVPPTVKLANLGFGERDAPILFGWIMAGHQLGAATAALALASCTTRPGAICRRSSPPVPSARGRRSSSRAFRWCRPGDMPV